MKHRKRLSLLLALILALSLFSGHALAADGETEAPLTRGEFLTALYEMSGDAAPGESQTAFADVPPDGAFAPAIRWAMDRGIVNGYGNGRFGPDDPVTLEQMAVMLYRSALALDQAPRGDWLFPLGFLDADEISPWADKAVQWAVMNRILSGTGQRLMPKAAVTEEQLAPILEGWTDFLVPEGESRGTVILYTSDVHCGIDKGFGYAGLQEVRDALIAQGYAVLLVDDGDSIQGEPVGTMTKGEAILGLMNRLGYSAAIPGNHEFDYGMEQFLSLAGMADFAYISCNFTCRGEQVFRPYVIRELGGKRIAFVGVTTPQTIITSTPGFFQDETGEFIYGFLQDETGEGVYSAVQSAADEARAEGADHVILMGHLGNSLQSAPWNYADVISHTRGIDAVLDGHSHDADQVVMKNAEGVPTPRSACGTKLANIGWCFIAPDGKVSTGLYTWSDSVPAPEKLGIDNEMARAVAEATEALDRKLGETVAVSTVELTIYDPAATDAGGKPIRMIRRAETNLGDLCADAYLDQSGADIAIAVGGSIRANLAAGDITLRDILTVHPFGNYLCVAEVTGQQILDALEWGARIVPGECGGFLQVSGLTYEIHSYLPSPCLSDENGMFLRVEGERRVKNVLVAGEPIDLSGTYTLAGLDYTLKENGDGFTVFDGVPVLRDGIKLDHQVLIDYMAGTLGGVVGEAYADPCGQGRITIVDSPAEP